MQNYYIKNMEKRLTDEERKLLKAIYAPQVVAVPLSDCGRSMCVTPDGEIRLYGLINKKEPEDIGTPAYLVVNRLRSVLENAPCQKCSPARQRRL